MEGADCEILCDRRLINRIHFASKFGLVGIIEVMARLRAMGEKLPDYFTYSLEPELSGLIEIGDTLEELVIALKSYGTNGQIRAYQKVEKAFEKLFSSDLKSGVMFIGLEEALFIEIL